MTGLVIASGVVGICAMGAWFWLKEPEMRRFFVSAHRPSGEVFYDRAVWACFLIGLGAMGLCLLLALIGS